MIVLSVGMPRAGSGWHYNLIHDLMMTAGATDAHEIRERYRLQRVLTEVNCNIGVLSARRLALVTVPALLGNTFVIKAHSGPTFASRLLQMVGMLRITYIYRDPRDTVLSAYEFGQRALAKGRPNAFSHLTGFQKSVDFTLNYVRIWEKWIEERDVLIARYEDMLTNYDHEVARLINFLKVDGSKPDARAERSRSVQNVIAAYSPEAAEGQKGVHFNKGQIGRFREVYSAGEQAMLNDILGPYLERMGYTI